MIHLPGKSSLLFATTLSLLSLLVLHKASAETTIRVNSNTGNNHVSVKNDNGSTSTTSVESKSKTRIEVNGKVYVDDENGGTHDIVDDSNGGKVEIHVNSDKDGASGKINTNVSISPKPTKDINPTLKQAQEDLEKEVEEARKEQKSIIESIGESITKFFSNITSIFAREK